MPLSKRQKRTNEIIQKEQRTLLSIQRELEEILSKIYESINVLKVEELQLKASEVEAEKQSNETTNNLMCGNVKSESSELKTFNSVSTSLDWMQSCSATETVINEQEVDLCLNSLSYSHQNIEEDDE